MNKVEVKINQITRSSKILLRHKIDPVHLARFVEDMIRGDKFPAVQAVSDGKDYWLYDGNHRVHANLKNGNSTIWVDIIEGTARDAELLALSANAAHGERRSNEDKNKAVTKCLLDEEWGQWSDGMVADICRVSQTFVSSKKRELTQHGAELSTTTRGKDKKVRNTKKIGKHTTPRVPKASKKVGGQTNIKKVRPKTNTGGKAPKKNELDGIENVDTLKSMFFDLQAAQIKLENESQTKDTRIIVLKTRIAELKKINQDLKIELQSALKAQTNVTGYLNTNSMNDNHSSLRA